MIPNKLDIIVGSKYQHHYLNGDSILPSLKVRYTPNNQNTIWASYSNSIRNPSKLETSLRRVATNLDSTLVYWKGMRDFKNEEISSYEIGYRSRFLNLIELDISGFYNKYKNVRSFEPNFAELQFELENNARATSSGITFSTDINLLNRWNLLVGYSYLDLDVSFSKESNDSVSIHTAATHPFNLFQIQSRYNISNNIDYDLYFYYIDKLRAISVPSYTRLDMRLAWRPTINTELSLIAQKLFSSNTRETGRVFYSTHSATYGDQFNFNLKVNF